MSNRFMNQLPWLALAIAAMNAQQAHAATQTTSVPSVVFGPAGTSYVNFEIPPLQSSSVSIGTPVDVYFKGQLDGTLHCKNPDGCGAISLAIDAGFYFNVPGTSGSLKTSYPFTFVSYGPTAYGDYLDLKAIKLASDPVSLPYDLAKYYGLISDSSNSVLPLLGSLSVGYGSVMPDGNSWQQFQDFDHFTYGLIDPTFNIHYFAAAVPEPSSYAMVAVGLAALTMVRRRVKQVR